MVILYKLILLSALVLVVVVFIEGDKLFNSFKVFSTKQYKTFVGYTGKKSVQYDTAIAYKSNRKIKKYRMYSDIITILGLKQEGVTVWGFKVFLLVLNISFSLLATQFLNLNVIIGLGIFVLMRYLIIAVLNLRVSAIKERREIAVLDSLDIIISGIDNSVVNSIRKYIETFDKTVRGSYELFLTLIDKNVVFEKALKTLTDDLGVHAEKFYFKALLFNEVGGEGSRLLFDDIVFENGIKREQKQKTQEVFQELRLTFSVGLMIILGVFMLIVLSDKSLMKLLFTSIVGQAILLANLGLIVWVFCKLILLQSESITE